MCGGGYPPPSVWLFYWAVLKGAGSLEFKLVRNLSCNLKVEL